MSTFRELDSYDRVFNFGNYDSSVSLSEYQQNGGYEALRMAIGNPKQALEEICRAGLRGRGGAAFPAGLKLKMMQGNTEKQRYIVCNADEGEPGTFKDRFIMNHIPFQLLEGITIAAILAGAENGFVYIRHEYPLAQETIKKSIAEAEAAGLLGDNILGSEFSLHLKIFSGAGSYLCGEETALLSSIEGKKGRPRVKPPFPIESGLWGKPTLINNVETLANIPAIIAKGSDWY